MQKYMPCEQKQTGDMISDVNQFKYALAASMCMQGTISSENETLMMQKRASCQQKHEGNNQ